MKPAIAYSFRTNREVEINPMLRHTLCERDWRDFLRFQVQRASKP